MKTERRDDRGFTLIELMVVVLIVAVLITLAVPTFLGARERAQDRVPQASLKLALGQARGLTGESFTGATPLVLENAEPSLSFLPGAASAAAPDAVSVAVLTTDASDDTFVAASYSNAGKCFYVRDVSLPAAASTSMGTTFAVKLSDGTDCTAANIAGLTFSSKW